MVARHSINSLVPPPDLDDRLDDLRIAISELVSNAVLHAGLRPGRDSIRLTIERDVERVRVEVEQATSADDARIVESQAGQGPGGFGLRLVESLADRWGVEDGPPGHVWFEFAVDGEPGR
jgi:two-component sensor histidine kinase